MLQVLNIHAETPSCLDDPPSAVVCASAVLINLPYRVKQRAADTNRAAAGEQ